MENLKSLFIIFLLLIFISLVLGTGVSLMSLHYGFIITGISLVLSSLAILYIFIYEFVIAHRTGGKL